MKGSWTYLTSLIPYSPIKPVLRGPRMWGCSEEPCSVFSSRSIDLSEALSLPGVVDIVTEEDLRGVNSFGLLGEPEKLLETQEVLHCCFLF